MNRILRLFGLMIVPRPNSSKMLHEHANVSEAHHPSRGGNTVAWMRNVAYMVHATEPRCERDPRFCEGCIREGRHER